MTTIIKIHFFTTVRSVKTGPARCPSYGLNSTKMVALLSNSSCGRGYSTSTNRPSALPEIYSVATRFPSTRTSNHPLINRHSFITISWIPQTCSSHSLTLTLILSAVISSIDVDHIVPEGLDSPDIRFITRNGCHIGHDCPHVCRPH